MLESLPVVLFLLVLLSISARAEGPIRALVVAWLVCLLPILTGFIRYGFSGGFGFGFPLLIIGSIACFVLGALLHELNSSPGRSMPPPVSRWLAQRDFIDTLPVARFCWWLGAVGVALVCLDFYLFGGVGLSDIAALRDAYVGRVPSVPAQLGSVLTWACLYCFGFALAHRQHLGAAGFARFLLPVAGYFLVAVFSAGRQTAFQILIFTVIVLWICRIRAGRPLAGSGRSTVFAISLSVAMIAYMGYIAVVRNDAAISDDKVQVLALLFDLELSPFFERTVGLLGSGVRTTAVEGMVYFSSAIALFEKFLELDKLGPYFGAMSFPFIFRQIEPLTGISVIGAYMDKVDALNALGVIGVGWTTGISSYMLDFGLIGACVMLVLQGYYSSFAWRRAINGAGFHDAMIAAVTVAAAVYLPLLAATSDTNLLFVWLFCIVARSWNVGLALRLRRRVGLALRFPRYPS